MADQSESLILNLVLWLIGCRTMSGWVFHQVEYLHHEGGHPTTTTGIEAVRARYLPLLWPVRQLGAAVEHNDVILYLSLHTMVRFNPIP